MERGPNSAPVSMPEAPTPDVSAPVAEGFIPDVQTGELKFGPNGKPITDKQRAEINTGIGEQLSKEEAEAVGGEAIKLEQEVELAGEIATKTIVGTDPTTGLYHTDHMPMTNDLVVRQAREKQLAGETLTLAENMVAGRDTTVKELEGEQLKPDHAYRAVDTRALEDYLKTGVVGGIGENDEYHEGDGNKGVDWYLGGAALKYGDVVLEVPASPDLFLPATGWGQHLAKDPTVRHMKSSGSKNPVPMERVRILQQLDKQKTPAG